MRFSSGVRAAVTTRAGDRCEYCRLAQAGQEATFHIDHVIPIIAGGKSAFDNLALACVSCSLRKGSQTQGIDPETNASVSIFSPRQMIWSEHFRWETCRVIGRTAIGRATVALLDMNRPIAVAIRVEESYLGRHPPREFPTPG